LSEEAHFYLFGDFLPEHFRDFDVMVGGPYEKLAAQNQALIR